MSSITDTLAPLAEQFERVNVAGLSFEAECHFADQQISRNRFTADQAAKNPASLADAILSVGAIGLSLSPASALCYLVPRDGKIALDISYRGLVRLATDAGSILMAKPILVYEGDKFTWRGPAEMPVHEADVFAAARVDAQQPLKGLVGGYCVAWLPGGAVMVDVMSVAEIMAVKAASKSDKGPWAGAWAGEMAKKTLVKRASKSWPTTPASTRLDAAIAAGDETEGEDAQSLVHVPAPNSATLDIPPPAPAAPRPDPLAAARRPASPPEQPPAPDVDDRRPHYPPPATLAELLNADGTVHSKHGTMPAWLDALEALAVSAGPTMGAVILGRNADVLAKVAKRGIYDERITRIKAAIAPAPVPAAMPEAADDVF